MPPLHVFIDESGDFVFSGQGTRYFLLTAVSTMDCRDLYGDYFDLKHRLAHSGLGIEEFHATEDPQAVRNAVYDLIERHCSHGCMKIDAIIAEKSKAKPEFRDDDTVFYARMLHRLLQAVFEHPLDPTVDSVLVWPARIGVNRRKTAFEKSVKTYLAHLEARVPYRIFIHRAASHPMLQVADYCSWALAKKWKDREMRPYAKISCAVRTESEAFRDSMVEE